MLVKLETQGRVDTGAVIDTPKSGGGEGESREFDNPTQKIEGSNQDQK